MSVFKKKKSQSSKISIESINAIFGEAAKADGFDTQDAVQECYDSAELLHNTMEEAFPGKADDDNFDFKGAVVSAVNGAANATEHKTALDAANAQMSEIKSALGLDAEASAEDVLAAVKGNKEKADEHATVVELFGEDANAEDFNLPKAVEGLQANGGGSRTTTKSSATEGGGESGDDKPKFEDFPHNQKVMEELDAVEAYNSGPSESKQ